jgi:MoaA/NifB/PqqE/SkfB family radical SAM enzyme
MVKLNLEQSDVGGGKYFLEKYPETIVIDTSYLCNLQCKMCHQNSDDFKMPDKPHIELDLVKRLLPLCKDSGSVYLLGYGEPLMHPKIYEIVNLIKDYCPDTKVSFTSNGVLMNDRNINKLIDGRLDLISISMDGPELERGHQKSEITYKNVRRLKEIKAERGVNYPEIHIGFVLGKDNENELIPIIEFAKEVGATGITVEPLRIVAPNPEWDDYILENNIYNHTETIGPIMRKAKVLAGNYGIRINTPYIVGV